MKQILLSGLLVMAAGQLYAQPVITRSQFVTSFTDSIHILDPGTIGPGPAGANVTWDFSSLPAPQVVHVVEAGDCPGSNTICASFPAANAYNNTTIAGQTGHSFAAMLVSDQQVDILGGQNNSDPVYTFADVKTVARFPVTYGQTYTDRYALSTGGITQYGTNIYLVDGYGTIITPAGTFTDVLRIRTEVYDTATSTSGTFAGTGVSYSWVRANQPQTIMGYVTAAMVLPGPQPLPSSILYGGLPPVNSTGIKDQDLLESSVTLYPNPAKGNDIRIRTGAYRVHNLKVTDLTGKVVYHETINHTDNQEHVYSISAGNLAAGMYLVMIATDKGTLTRKVSVMP